MDLAKLNMKRAPDGLHVRIQPLATGWVIRAGRAPVFYATWRDVIAALDEELPNALIGSRRLFENKLKDSHFVKGHE